MDMEECKGEGRGLRKNATRKENYAEIAVQITTSQMEIYKFTKRQLS